METAGESARKAASFPYFTSGSRALDDLLGGGFRAGRLVELFGKSNSGKSQVAMQTALHAARGGTRSLYIDTEGSFRPERIGQMAEARGWPAEEALGLIVYVRSDSASEQMETIRGMATREATSQCRLVVVDTLTRNFSVELPGNANMQSRQAALGVHLSEMARDAYLGGRAYVLTNRVTFGAQTDVGIGGKTVEQLVDVSVRLERTGGVVRATRTDSGVKAEIRVGAAGVD